MRKVLLISGLAAGVLLLAIGAGVFFVVFGPNTGAYDEARGVKIPRNADFDAVTDSLEAAGILGSRSTFEFVGRVTGWAGQVKAGYYEIESGASNYRILDTIRKGLQTPIRLTIPPGTRPDVMAAVAGNVMAFTAEEFLNALEDSSLARRLGTDAAHLFGFMMPETYSFYWLTDAPTIVARIKESFDTLYENELAAGASSLNLNREEVVRLASIVEWETGIPEEKPIVAGVYLNRLRIGMPLQADPTIQFAVIQREGQKRRLLYADYRLDSPFNTYLFAGLPPAPITNPSPSSLRAVASPDRHDYLYFVARGDGSHTFSRTFEEHRRAAAEYRTLMEQRRAQQSATAP